MYRTAAATWPRATRIPAEEAEEAAARATKTSKNTRFEALVPCPCIVACALLANIPDIVQAYNEAGAADEGEEDEGGDAAAGASADEDGGGGMKFVGKKKKGSTKKGKILGEKGDDIMDFMNFMELINKKAFLKEGELE